MPCESKNSSEESSEVNNELNCWLTDIHRSLSDGVQKKQVEGERSEEGKEQKGLSH